MAYLYIGTILVMLVLILFTSLAILTLVKRTTHNIKGRTLDLISIYDSALELKSLQLSVLRKEIEELEEYKNSEEDVVEVVQENNFKAHTLQADDSLEIISKSNYLSKDVGLIYQGIKNNFNFDLDRVFKELKKETSDVQDGTANAFLKQLSYENVYSLTFLSPQEQITCLEESIDEKFKPLLKNYIEENEVFSSIEFYAYITEIADLENKKATIFVPSNVEVESTDEYNVVKKDSLIEGIQIEINHKLYDYAIAKKEIG